MREPVELEISRKLIREEIERIVAEAQTSGSTLSTSRHAATLLASYPGAGWSVGHIIDELVTAASSAKVAVEIDRTSGSD